MSKGQVDIGIAASLLRFMRKYRRKAPAIRISPDILDLFYTKEEQLNTKRFSYMGTLIVVDDKMKPGTVEAIWLH
jgi:hypothetical protein